MNHSSLPKCCCTYCSKELYVRYFNAHLKYCKLRDKKRNIDYVICPICGKRVKEINNIHLNSHNLTIKEFDNLYPDFNRLSKKSRIKKATFTGKSHTEEYKKHMSEVMKGINKGKILTKNHKEKISKSCKKIWKERYDELCYTKTYEYYIKKWGEKGKKRWHQKNYRNSQSSKIIKNKKGYKLYKEKVSFFTNYSLEKFNIEGKEKLGRYWHLDHKYPQAMGFNNNIPPFIIGSPKNLQVVDRKYNCSKQHYYTDIDLDILITETYNNIKYMNGISEFMRFIHEIRTTRKIQS